MSPAGGLWAPAALRLLRVAFTKGSRALRTKLGPSTSQVSHTRTITNNARQPTTSYIAQRSQRRVPRIKAFNTPKKQPAFLQSLRRYLTTESGVSRFDRSKFPKSQTATRVAQQSGRAPFCTTLRPNLTGGAIPRSAGGYSLGGGAGVRYFSHTPASSAQVVNNVSQAMRAFCLSGQRARFDGLDTRGNPNFRSVSLEDEKKIHNAIKAPRTEPGSFVEFRLSPVVTALTPLASVELNNEAVDSTQNETIAASTLNADGVMDGLALDFMRAWRDLSVVFEDLKKFSQLGDLPITLESSNLIRIRFPGVDARTLENICDDLGMQRGVIGEDREFGKSQNSDLALKFPFAPGMDDTDACGILLSPEHSLSSDNRIQDMFIAEGENPWLSDIEETLSRGLPPIYAASLPSTGFHCSDEFDGLSGIYKFIDVCEREQARNRFN
ncbi:hypothetical protein Cpir12675_005809 [Ceratocystis pirilliformis]|uniref:Casein kinase II beta 2 subunit n=1 Tax=Ceratocystis pirilliformis TaxID=259994 RepID=A0ABR3YNF1_9PEZI